jgi:hypothetical protein
LVFVCPLAPITAVNSSEATSEAEDNDDQTIDDIPVAGVNHEAKDSEVSQQASPPPTTGLLFSDSPTKLKRKRMEELAAERSQRRRI